jgi:hypothetical protein
MGRDAPRPSARLCYPLPLPTPLPASQPGPPAVAALREAAQTPVDLAKLQSDLAAIEHDVALYDELNFDRRVAAIDRLEFAVIDQIDVSPTARPPDELAKLRQRAERVTGRLKAVDERLFARLRADIRAGRCRGDALLAELDRHVRPDEGGRRRLDEPGFDNLDVFVNGLLDVSAVPDETVAADPEMVPYNQTPARIVFELVARARFRGGDVFYDLGSGLGQVPILVNLLAGVPARGVEIEPAYCEQATLRAAALRLPDLAFVNADVRGADCADGTTFYLYTPFEGSIMRAVLAMLRRESRRRRLRLFTYGPCTAVVAREDWLARVGQDGGSPYRLGEFASG